MIQRSLSLERRMEREALRYAGSLTRIIFYKGNMPLRCELQADGERIASLGPAPEEVIRGMLHGKEPPLPEGATYWRLMDGNGNVVMQGDGK